MEKKRDCHLHTFASDGEMTPGDILTCAHELHIHEISITDHDSIGAYSKFGEDPIKKANELGCLLIPGIELDSDFSGVEVHVLGYEINLECRFLNSHLSNIQLLRRKRVKEQIHLINQVFKREILREEDIFLPSRDTVMKPHLIRPMIRDGFFSEYREAAQWLSNNIKPATTMPKFSTTDMVDLVKNAGGKAFLAHPGYYLMESGLNIDDIVQKLLPFGLDGIEVYYPYLNSSPKFRTPESERTMIALLELTARKYNLEVSSGSDAHNLTQMRAFQQR